MNKNDWKRCAFQGSTTIEPCQNLVRGKTIFCIRCMAILPFGVFADWLRDFYPRLTYDEAMKSERHREAIRKVHHALEFAKSQNTIFDLPIFVPTHPKHKKDKR